MATVSGNDGAVKIGSTAVAKVQSFQIDREANMERDDGMGDAWQSQKAGKKRWSGTIEVLYDAADTGQDAIDVGDEGTGNFYPEGDSASNKYLTGNFVVARVGHTQNQDGRVTQSIAIEGQGALTEATVGA